MPRKTNIIETVSNDESEIINKINLPQSEKNIDRITEYVKKWIEYKNNPIKFMEECIQIPTPGGNTLIKLYEPQKRIVESFFKDHYLIILKSRQIGISTITQALITYIFVFYKNCKVGIVSRKAEEASDFSCKVQDMIDNLPDWLRPKYKTKRIQKFSLENGCELSSASVSPANPGSVLRSKSITLLVIDEAAHILNISEAWTGMANTVSKAQQDAKRRNIPYGTIIISTPNKTQGIGQWFYETWCKAEAGENIFVPHKIKWTEIPDFANDPTWYETQCKLLNNDRNKIAQELDLKFISSEDSLFDEDIQIKLQENIDKQTYTEIRIPDLPTKNYKFSIFKETNKNALHLIGIDIATPAGRDRTAIQIVEYSTGEQVAEFFGKPDPKMLYKIVRYIHNMFPNNLIIIENTGGFGQSLIYDLMYDEDYNFNLYGETRESTNKYVPGLSVNTKTRPLLLDALFTTINSNINCIKSKYLSSELLSLTVNNNKIEANTGFHDDLAMAFAMCCYVRKYKTKDIAILEYTQEEIEEFKNFNISKEIKSLNRYINDEQDLFAEDIEYEIY